MVDDRSPYDLAGEAADRIRHLSPIRPRLAVVLGSGLGAALDLANATVIPYGEIPHFPVSTVLGHSGTLLLADVEGTPTALLSGRAHMYEGYSADQVVFGVRVMHRLGVEAIVLTNAAGGVNWDFHPGQLMLITDHLNLTGHNPLVGPNDERLGFRFVDLSDAYSLRFRELAHHAAADCGIELAEGVYCGLLGPTFETPAEIRMLRALGADAVGMSTVLEAIAANHARMEVLGISCITNMAAGMLPQKLSHTEVIETTALVRESFARLLLRIISLIGNRSS